jgi:hypothetical protein
MALGNIDRQEALQYRPGQRVELKQRPGTFDVIAAYEPEMVPPITLENDPQPRYPEELSVCSDQRRLGWLAFGDPFQMQRSA